jgi:transcriptional regulator with XRE-family HTH domain
VRDGDGLDLEDVPAVEAPGAPVGEQLREARATAGMTLEQVSAGTRIRVPVLRELEADRLGPASSAVYTRGHIRAIAAVLGVDPAPIVRAFDDTVGAHAPSLPVVPDPVPAPRRPAGGLSVPVSAPPDRTSPRWLVASLAGVTVLVALLAIGMGLGGDSDRAREQALTVSESSPTPTPEAAPAPAPVPAPASLDLRATGRSWLSVRNRGGVELFGGLVDAGWTRRFEDPVAVTVRVGNAAAVSASCAGAPVPPGAEGAPVTLRCAPEGLARQ